MILKSVLFVSQMENLGLCVFLLGWLCLLYNIIKMSYALILLYAILTHIEHRDLVLHFMWLCIT